MAELPEDESGGRSGRTANGGFGARPAPEDITARIAAIAGERIENGPEQTEGTDKGRGEEG
jgi:hypothetical protein